MKTKITKITVMFLAFLCSSAQADIIWDSGHHVFSEGYESHILMYNDASAEISGGLIGEFNMYDITTSDTTGGYIGIVRSYNNSAVDVYEFSEINHIKTRDSSTANLYGGSINILSTCHNSVSRVYEGVINKIDSEDSSIVFIYCDDDYFLDPTGGVFGYGLLTGNWFYSGNSFSISLTENTFDHIICISEPCSILLLTTGGFLLKCHNE